MSRKIKIALTLLLSILCAGVIGFMVTMDLDVIDALYMTVITITTVGYREIGNPSPQAKLFIIALILVSVVAVGYAVSVFTEYLISRSSVRDIIFKRQLKQIKNMENHVIVCGYGRNGRQAVEKLQDYNRDFIVLEKNQEVIDEASLDSKYFLRGNANEDETLLNAGIERASVLISALPDDADNLFVVLSARQLNSKLMIISRASEETTVRKLKLAGANNVILPDLIGGQHMASLIVSPDLIEFWDNLSYGGNDGVNLEQVSFEQMFDHQKSCNILDLNLRKETGCTIIGYKNPNGDYIVNPDPSIELVPGSKIIVVGNTNQIQHLQKVYRIGD
ncbi:potassium channel family protein [Nonlabens sp. SY33080]|uniref:potassium channel family protein n=1 Tax=Nonlabens sp. SY33080 TaxID=2719911 RepID=UPI001428B8D4|nr:potassium channel protein [Nonlabens sp. SY33080]